MKTVIRKLDNDSVLTLDVTLSKEFKIRVKIFILLIQLAAWVLGTGTNI